MDFKGPQTVQNSVNTPEMRKILLLVVLHDPLFRKDVLKYGHSDVAKGMDAHLIPIPM